MLTAYDYSNARLIDEAGVNAILVGDSLGMVVLGYEDTLSVTMEDMILHSAAVARGIKDTLLINKSGSRIIVGGQHGKLFALVFCFLKSYNRIFHL